MMVIAVFLPEIVLAAAFAAGVHEIKVGGTWGLDNGNWTYAVMFAWDFSLLLGSAFVLGGVVRAGMVTLRNTGTAREKALLWMAVAACVAGEIAHWRGYVGSRHIARR